MPKHGRQHWVNQSYLAAWIDPDTPPEQEGYVWLFPKTGGKGRRKAPKNVFYETDMYTIKLASGKRDVRIEKSLSLIEGMFAPLRERVAKREELTDEDRAVLCVFTAAMYFRSRKSRDHLRGQFKNMLRIGREMTEHMRAQRKALPPKEYQALSRRMVGGPKDESRTLSMADVQRLADEPLQQLMWPLIQPRASELFRMNLSIVCASDDLGWITSDTPTAVRMPGLDEVPLFRRPPGFSWPTTEVFLPLSPESLALFHWDGNSAYTFAPQSVQDEINQVIRWYAQSEIVVHRNETRPVWFVDGWNRAAANDNEGSVSS
jgi:hypothetical protein